MSDEKPPVETPAPPAAEPAATEAQAKPAAPRPPAPKPAAPAGPKKWESTGEVAENSATAALKSKFGDAVTGVKSPCKEAVVLAPKTRLIEILAFLRDDAACSMNYLSDLTGAHFPINDKKFEVAYHLYSLTHKHSLRVKVQLDDGESCPTATGVWPGADWMEREAHDLLGIVFEGHPNLKVILLPEDFEGHPLRKEFPLGGKQEEMIRSNKYGKPVYLPEDIEEARMIIEEHRHGS